MRELGHQGEQQRQAGEMVDRQADMGRALKRGGARGDVQDCGVPWLLGPCFWENREKL